jgi:branched-chain amino acid aminotransferase
VSEAIMLNEHGNVSEATGDNIFIVKNGQVITSPVQSGILVGITRGLVMELARSANLTMVEKDFGPSELYGADECFLTGSAAEVIPVTRIDDKTIGTGKVGDVTRRLVTDFRALIAREVS